MSFNYFQITTQNLHTLKPLAEEAELEGHNFVQRTILEWKSGKNDFSKKGEILFGIFDSDLCIGIGGLNIDPYVNDEKLGRVRHLYISKKYRRMGLATRLLEKIISFAQNHFTRLRLYTDNPSAALFYESLGFVKSNGIKETHIYFFVEAKPDLGLRALVR
ncbi:MAG: GNAT family N-acetyltransferase [Calditrichaeota bacterium]|nr:MAG: GNAT family N-acetyltransferase [Calditrichota bacterium]